MSSSLRGVLLSGCALIAALEAPGAAAWLRASLAGPYSLLSVRRPVQSAAVSDLPGSLPFALPVAPTLLALTPISRSSFPTLAVER
jgi:hypothetical protein